MSLTCLYGYVVHTVVGHCWDLGLLVVLLSSRMCDLCMFATYTYIIYLWLKDLFLGS